MDIILKIIFYTGRTIYFIVAVPCLMIWAPVVFAIATFASITKRYGKGLATFEEFKEAFIEVFDDLLPYFKHIRTYKERRAKKFVAQLKGDMDDETY